LIVVASVAMPKNTSAVPPKAMPIKVAPLLKPSIAPISRESIRPMKKVKPSSRATPTPEFLNFSMAKKKPKAMPRNSMKPMKGLPAKKLKPVVTPTQAPRTVGTIDSANSQ
jgi:hypothetical protein